MSHRMRAEEKAVLIWSPAQARTAYISGEELNALVRFTEGRPSGFSQRLQSLGLLTEADIPVLKSIMVQGAQMIAPPDSFCAPESLHIEITARCPLRCPQCYKDLSDAELPAQVLADRIRQADAMNVFQIALGGGEPLGYPHLIEAIADISGRGMGSSVTTSGLGLHHGYLQKLQTAGLNHIQISLNGSCQAVHALSRDGYTYALNALSLLSGTTLSFGINWVARADNIDDLPALITLAKKYGAGNINILRYKPPRKGREDFAEAGLCGGQMKQLAEILKTTKGLSLKVDSAFSNLLCYMNGRAGAFTGCGAGRRFLAVDAEGFYRPCSHVDLKERGTGLADVWAHSPHLAMFRLIPRQVAEPCASCAYLHGCRGCRAVAGAQGQDFFSGDEGCPFARRLPLDPRKQRLS